MHFDRHVRTIQALVVKARQQCERFLRYAASGQEVPLYQLIDGRHQEVRRLRLSDYRLVLPIGLTIESFTPFSSMSKRLEEMSPILGKFPFVSMSIDDLFVLNRFLPTTGELLHYLTTRQCIAGQRDVFLFDELDHLGAYIEHNRIDQLFDQQLKDGPSMVINVGSSTIVDQYFADSDWEGTTPPRQPYPICLAGLLGAIDETRGPRALEADAAIRDLGLEGREDIARAIEKLIPSLRKYPFRWFAVPESEPMLIWLQRESFVDFTEEHARKAEATALAAKASHCKVVMLFVRENGHFAGAWAKNFEAPDSKGSRYAESYAEAQKMLGRAEVLTPEGLEKIHHLRGGF